MILKMIRVDMHLLLKISSGSKNLSNGFGMPRRDRSKTIVPTRCGDRNVRKDRVGGSRTAIHLNRGRFKTHTQVKEEVIVFMETKLMDATAKGNETNPWM